MLDSLADASTRLADPIAGGFLGLTLKSTGGLATAES